MQKKSRAFSLIELSIVILIIGILIAGVTQSSRIIAQARLSTAQTQTRSSAVHSVAGILLWFEPTINGTITNSDDNIEVNNNDKINSWNDVNSQTNDKINAIQIEDEFKPLFTTNQINYLPAIKFDGVDDHLLIPNIAGGSFTVFAVLKTNRLGNYGSAYEGMSILHADVGGSYNDVIPLAIGDGYAEIFTGDSSGGDYTATGNIFVSDNIPHIISTTRNMTDGEVNIYVDGQHDISDILLPGLKNDNPNITIGGNIVDLDPYRYFDGLLGEIVIFDHVLKNEERKSIEAYLSRKWGIKIS
jgi:prepilin-type N-terminal cleavage/methylation domain-containing protein